MISSLENSTPSTTNSFNKRPRPKAMLKLNVNLTTFEEKNIVISQNSTSSYTIQNHPQVTDVTESLSSSKYVFKKVFFGDQYQSKNQEDSSFLGTYFYITQKSNGKEMQDTYKAKTAGGLNNINFFAVYDGHSTQSIAEMLAEKLDGYIIDSLKEGVGMDLAIKEAFIKAENEVALSLKERKPRGGSTALCGIFHHMMLYVANLGDSRAVMFRDNSFTTLSNLHDFTNESERLYVESKGGIVINNRLEGELAVSRSIGDVRYNAYMNKEPEIMVHQVQDKDEYLILGTDGYWNGMGPELTLAYIQALKERSGGKEIDLKVLGDALIEEACQNVKTKKDNMTLIIVNIGGFLQSI